MKKSTTILTLCIIIAFLLSSCGRTMYNVGTGKPMTKSCHGAWMGGQ
jgi:predicted small secreted protein